MQSNLDDAGTGAILTGQATNTAWSFAGASSSQSETRQYTDHLNRTVSTATYVAGGRGESTTRYGARAGNRSFTADDVPDHTPDPSSFVAYSSTASEGKGTEYLKMETTFTYDDTQGDEWEEQRNANQLEIYVNTVTVGSDSGILLSAGGGLERFGSTSIEFQSTVHYRQHSDYLGTAFDTQNPSEILWTYGSNRDASFDHTATLTITVYPLVDSLVISYTSSGDSEVNLTGEDDWGRDWEKTELELSLEGMAATSQDSILAENPDAIDAANDTNKQDTSTWQQVGGQSGTQQGVTQYEGEFVPSWGLLNPFSWSVFGGDGSRGVALDAKIKGIQTNKMLAEQDVFKQIDRLKRIRHRHAQAGGAHTGDLITIYGEGATIIAGSAVVSRAGGLGYPGSMAGAPKSGFNIGSFVGKQAKVAPHLPAGKYTALVVDGEVYVARMHNVAWEMAGKKGVESFYGFAEIDAAGKVIRLFK